METIKHGSSLIHLHYRHNCTDGSNLDSTLSEIRIVIKLHECSGTIPYHAIVENLKEVVSLATSPCKFLITV